MRKQLALFTDDTSGKGHAATVIALMTLLACLMLAATLVIYSMAGKWRSDLAGQATIEIPARDAQGNVSPRAALRIKAQGVAQGLADIQGVTSVNIMDDAQVKALLSPWLGDMASGGDDLPLPALIAVTYAPEGEEQAARATEDMLARTMPQARLDRHKDWLDALHRLSSALMLTFITLGLAVMTATGMSVAGAVRAGLNQHAGEIELLHVMGASDGYILDQFQSAMTRQAAIAAAVGFCLAVAAMTCVRIVAGSLDAVMLSRAGGLGMAGLASLVLVPLLVTFLSRGVTRATVLRALARMP